MLGGVALVVAMIVYSCSASSGTSATGVEPPAAADSSSPSQAAAPPPATTSQPTAVAPPPASPSAAPDLVADAPACTNEDIRITAVPAVTTMVPGDDVLIRLFIKNVSERACNRDVGPDLQELYIARGTERIWSSDHCDGPIGSEIRTLPPAHERSYETIWNGQSSTSCDPDTKRSPNGPVPTAGEYELFGRLGTALSQPVILKISSM